ncbi:MAG: helix-turn-helix transcriptional regulator [Neisseria sp.]|nr:helix-turn-helix transcriptional regulator [Neisseria sp.]
MANYHFTILIRDAAHDTENLEDRLFEAGCDDALLCFHNHTVYLEFDREAESAQAAVSSALDNIRQAGFQEAVLQENGFATLSEMAARAGLSRAALSNYARGQRGTDFPAPMYGIGSNSALYSWPEVASWLYRNGQLAKPQFDVAQVRC